MILTRVTEANIPQLQQPILNSQAQSAIPIWHPFRARASCRVKTFPADIRLCGATSARHDCGGVCTLPLQIHTHHKFLRAGSSDRQVQRHGTETRWMDWTVIRKPQNLVSHSDSRMCPSSIVSNLLKYLSAGLSMGPQTGHGSKSKPTAKLHLSPPAPASSLCPLACW